MRIKIVSNGDSRSTVVTDLETGENITDQVKAITWHVRVGKMATAEIEFIDVPVEIEAEVAE